MTRDKKTVPPKPALEQRIQSHLGEQLRKMYGSIAAEPVPERFLTLLDEMEREERSARSEVITESET